MSSRAPVPREVRRILDGDRRTLGQVISLVEDRDPRADPILRALFPHTGHARMIGITGPLGVGKSSLINALLGLLRAKKLKVGVIGIDPSSPFSGGSVLGDRIRIDRDAGDPGLFFRSMASRGYAGGIAAATRAVSRLLDAFGMDVVLVETVGSGQVDVEIRRVASTSVVVLVPHLGDEVQSLKAGLFEIADVFCVNKSDLPGSERAARYLAELSALGSKSAGWTPRVVESSTVAPKGIEELWSAIEAHETYLTESGERGRAERRRITAELGDIVREQIHRRLDELLEADRAIEGTVTQVERRKIDPATAADRIYAKLRHRL
jgi:LAO/AO transport system kinase